uniref:ORC-CDC6 family AAA ATPase n=1 Tax=Acinetobacter piscicola TaxID=2006115 RepID=UPI000B7EE38C
SILFKTPPINYLAKTVLNENDLKIFSDIESFKGWIHNEIKSINDAINNFAFTNQLNVNPPFSLGDLSINIKNAINLWHPSLTKINLIYLIDEIENFFSESQQQVIQSLIRYNSGLIAFRISGRLYALKTYATIGDGEENREDVEFKITYLDDLLQEAQNYKNFAYSFIRARLLYEKVTSDSSFNISACFQNINSNNYYESFINFLNMQNSDDNLKFINNFKDTLREIPQIFQKEDVDLITNTLVNNFPILIKKHNILRFCKDFNNEENYLDIAKKIHGNACIYLDKPKSLTVKSYKESYSHYAKDLIAQLNKDSAKPMIYCGFDSFIEMSNGNPRNLLSILSSAYDIARFKKLDFINGAPLSIENQSKAAVNSARFLFEQDSNFGRPSDLARIAVKNMADLLRVARFSLNIPESSPLTISFPDDDLSSSAKAILQSALNYSFVFEIKSGRPNRNNLKISRKISLNPMLSPIWELPIGKRGDIGLSGGLANAIFNIDKIKDFNNLLKTSELKWNQPFTRDESLLKHNDLFD